MPVNQIDPIILKVKQGLISSVDNPSNRPILIRDYDIDGLDEDRFDINKDSHGSYTEYEAEC